MRTLILDIGGVFYLGRPDATFWARWGARAGMTAEALEAEFWHGPDIEAANVGALSSDAYCARAGDRMGLEPDLVRQMTAEAFLADPNQRFADFVRELRGRGVPVSALTNSWSTEAALMARPLLAGLFDQVVSSCEVGLTKPDPAIFHLTLDRMGRAAGEVIFVDDTLAHVEAARGVGIETVWFRDTAAAMSEIERALGLGGQS